ncbi:SIR2 family protein [Xenorhabdus sp. KJ12.1]|uniref:SIR2 family protein n=1 Tax=Xenorhabdus sp. KJ12.1 TaxID=1851571 RepID=UPI000C0510B7|nr:SIR2 family protein [Xenorhabdus sp. KJ12.1]PHM70289.1 SIR2 family protein [Xenorhabdus sp. KJ12.1]
MIRDYKQYQSDVTDDIQACLESLECQPILFIGSGLARRYANGPDWEGLLKDLMAKCPEIKHPFAYYTQKKVTNIDIGTILSDAYRDWAWGDGRNEFPEELFCEDYEGDIYLKHKIADFFKGLNIVNQREFTKEIEALKKIRPHSIVTTNYDNIINNIFPDYEVIVGQQIIRLANGSIGEIFKIHGSCDEPESIVINKNDYDIFLSKKKYLSAKLLTFFAEHPLIFIGYSIEDENIKEILSDIDEILSEGGGLISNIYILHRDADLNDNAYPSREALIPIDNNKSIRVKRIVSNDFTWVFDAFSDNPTINNFDPKVLRALLARSYKLIRTDIPKNPVQIDYKRLSSIANESNELPRLYGITDASTPEAFNSNYPFSLTRLGQALGFKGWHGANDLLQNVKEITGVDLKSSDNKYHCAIMNGEIKVSSRYSNEAKELLILVKDGKKFSLDMG